jgi:putative oxidoreductase
MSLFEPAPPAWTARMLSVLRIITALIFITHGTMKLFAFPAGATPSPTPGMFSQAWIGGVLETFGGFALLLGLFTRPVAFLLAGEMAVAYFQFHYPRSVFPTLNGGDAAVLYCFIFLYFVFAGAGPWSVDAILAGRRRRPALAIHKSADEQDTARAVPPRRSARQR